MFDRVKSDIIKYMKEQDKFKLDVVRLLKSSIQMEAIKVGHELSDEEVLGVIKREVKKRNSSIEEYQNYGKTEMAETLKKEIDVLSEYLPEELSDEELVKVINDTINELGATSVKDMGGVIKTISSKYGASVDMSKVSKMVKEKLTN